MSKKDLNEKYFSLGLNASKLSVKEIETSIDIFFYSGHLNFYNEGLDIYHLEIVFNEGYSFTENLINISETSKKLDKNKFEKDLEFKEKIFSRIEGLEEKYQKFLEIKERFPEFNEDLKVIDERISSGVEYLKERFEFLYG